MLRAAVGLGELEPEKMKTHTIVTLKDGRTIECDAAGYMLVNGEAYEYFVERETIQEKFRHELFYCDEGEKK